MPALSSPNARDVFRLALIVSVVVAVASWAVGCGESQAPTAVGTIPDLRVEVGTTESVDLVGYFSDPDGDELGYEASSSDAEVATVAISSDSVAVTGVAGGSAEITVTASDGTSSASQVFTALVVPRSDRRVLEILYDELGGDDWTDNTNWKTDEPLDEWYGVGTGMDGRVDSLNLAGNSLSGLIPLELGELPSLRFLNLARNRLGGGIPPELGELSSLTFLHLGFNGLTDEGLTGEIPPQLGSLSSLSFLDLTSNSLTGEIPPQLGSLSNLRSLSFTRNSLTGEIPLDFLDLSSLELFFWNDNNGLCAPDTIEFDHWLDGLRRWRGSRCD